jgi:single-strand DNA-binding protein
MASVATKSRPQTKAQPKGRIDGTKTNQGGSVNGNTVTVVGNLTREPELRFVASGSAVTNFGIAVNRRKFNKETEEFDEVVSFFDITCWASLAENVAESLAKGDRVVVFGRLEQQSWEDDEGNNKSKVVLIADEVGPSLRWSTAELTKNA